MNNTGVALASFLFLEPCAPPCLATGPFHLLFPLPGTLSATCFQSTSPINSPNQTPLPQGSLPWLLHLVTSPRPHTLCHIVHISTLTFTYIWLFYSRPSPPAGCECPQGRDHDYTVPFALPRSWNDGLSAVFVECMSKRTCLKYLLSLWVFFFIATLPAVVQAFPTSSTLLW